MVKILRLFLPLLFFSILIHAQSIRVSAYTDTTDYKVGDYINYHVDVQRNKNVKLSMPSFKDSVKGVDFIEQKPVYSEESNNKVIDKYTFVFSKYDSGKAVIPGLKVFYTEGNDTTKKFLRLGSIHLTVHTLPVDQNADIKDVKGPLNIPLNILFIIIIVLIVLLLAVAAFFGYKYYKKKKAGTEIERITIKIPPHEIAISALRKLEERKLWQQGMVKEYHSEITEIIRRYFEARFGILAMEQPSSELLMNLNKIADAMVIYSKTEDFLNNADMVKFAKFQPMPTINEEMMKQAYEIVKGTIPKPTEEIKEEVKSV